MTLSIICCARAEPYNGPFLSALLWLADYLGAEFVIGVDGAVEALIPEARKHAFPVQAFGIQENVIDEVISHTRGDYILNIDDDEVVSPAMREWLRAGEYTTSDHWRFLMAQLWTPTEMILNHPLFPNGHERLSTREKSGGRPRRPHSRHPNGRGTYAPVMIEHHKFLIKSRETRRRIAEMYETKWPAAGLGRHHKPFNLPEDVYQTLYLGQIGDGTVGEWPPYDRNCRDSTRRFRGMRRVVELPR